MSDLRRFEAKYIPEPNSGCWLWIGGTITGEYDQNRGTFYLHGRTMNAPRASHLLHIGKIPPGKHVLHKCDNSACVNPDHLFLGTHQDNMSDMVRKGRSAHLRGVGHGAAKLNEAQVRAIRADNRLHKIIAQDYGISRTQISAIKRGERWAHITQEQRR